MQPIRLSKSDKTLLFIFHGTIFVLFLMVLYPLIYVISCSVSDPDLVASGRIWLIPKGLNILGYKRVFQDPSIITGYRNTLIYTLTGTFISLLVTVPAGYALSKSFIPGRNFFMGFFLFTMYFHGGLIPSFLLMRSLKLYNTPYILILLGAFSMYNCIICRTFFQAIPKEMEEAALIDGASPVRTFLTIVLPISQALMGVMILYFAIGQWNSYFPALVYLTKEELYPLQLVLRKILILDSASEAMMAAGDGGDEYLAELYKVRELIKYSVIVVSSLPMLCLYPFLQKYFAKGVMIGSLKG
ncbi:MAG: carbohydrate ABC transporter permease [Treponema sp.]|jgi:putative aldouronate transport system permease protein|nr:carbohydrate ABC transporter permease [Treponema sp.]